jgi:hypothetical protein
MTYLHDIHPDATIIDSPFSGHSGAGVMGYGKKIKTNYKVKIGNRLHRLYCMCWSNIGTLWVNVGGQQVIVSEHKHKRE